MKTKTHSDVGASIAERYWACPGSITLFGHLKSPPSFYAAQGTVAHEIAEFYLRKGVQVDTERLGEIVRIEEDGKVFEIEIDLGMLDAVSEYVDYVCEQLEIYGMECSDLGVEVGFNLKHIDENAFGTCDAVIFALDHHRLVVIDYKHGAGVAVGAEGNKQTLYYALGAYYSLDKEDRERLRLVETVIVQPRCAHTDGTIRKSFFTIEELLAWEAELSEAIRRVRSNDKTLVAGSHCKFCPGKPHCPEVKNEVARIAEVDFANIDLGVPPNPKTLTPEQIAHVLQFIPFIKDWCDGVLDYAHVLAESGLEVPGYKLVDKRSSRKWRENVEEDLDWILGSKMYAPSKIVSPAQAEKLLPKDKQHLISGLWEKTVPGKVLVRVEDDREERLPSALVDFANLDI